MHNLRRVRPAAPMLLLLPLLLLVGPALGDVFEECNAANDQQFVLSPKGCTYFILCNGEDSHEGECPEGDRFNAGEQMCELMEDIDCRTGLPIAGDAADAGMAEQLSTATAAPVEVEESTSSAANTDQPSSSVASVASTTSPPLAVSPITSIVATYCPATDSPNQIVLIAHDKSCTEYFICYRGQPIAMSCAASLHFNVRTGKCDRAEIVKCMTSTISVREQCKRDTVDIYPHPDNCNYYYYCRSGYLMLQQCPFFYGWDYDKRSCVAISQAKCYGRSQSRTNY
ncbi:hypothetical protein KR222_006621 [Zaprionus bogoriensis]|nr:hypothetical protein KR222_006621 [Zaprionus bogoriensis]